MFVQRIHNKSKQMECGL